MNPYRLLLLTLILACCGSAAAQVPSHDSAVMPQKHARILRSYCLDCHDSQTREGTVDLETIPFDTARDVATAERWAKVLNAINSGEMPPEGSEPIPDADKLEFLADLSDRMVAARRILGDSGGVVTLRRLNRREYANTVESLTGVRPDVMPLPDDQAGAGFDTDGASLFFSSDQLEQYLAVARRTLTLALTPTPPHKGRTIRIEPEEQYRELYAQKLAERRDAARRAREFLAQSEKPAREFGFIDRGQAQKQLRGSETFIPQLEDYLQRPETRHGATLISRIKTGLTRVTTRPINGGAGQPLLLRVRAARYEGVPPRYHYLEFSMRSFSHRYTRPLGWHKVTGTLDEPQIIEFPVDVPAGERVQFAVHQRTHQGRGDKNLWSLHRETNPIGTPPGLWVDWMEVVFPAQEGGLSEAARRILFPRPEGWSNDQYAREVITRFARRAFRVVEPAPEYLNRLVERYQSGRAAGQSLEEALIDPLAIVLSSPGFLYMVGSSGDGETLSDPELAVRLSYFLWSEPPDEELMQIARAGKLSQPEILRAQTERLLSDPRADRFVQGFVSQWLGLERLGMFQFEARYYPSFDNAVRLCARDEISQTVHLMLEQGLPLDTLLKADFVVVNDLLADYYGLEGVSGHEYRPVPVPADSPRGGLLGTAAVLAMGSDGIRTSPVERGAWVLRHLLHDPPPPAPPNVPQLSRLEGEVVSARQLQMLHQEQPQCAQCHRRIDPIGFGLENFDAAGQWREREIVWTGRRKNKPVEFPIEPSGQLYGGKAFADYFELRDVIAEQVDPFARNLTEALISYGLGRQYGFTDQELADDIVAQAAAGDFELSRFIHALVQSEAFRRR